jgi:transcriptional regulator with XRE-family HTH domain
MEWKAIRAHYERLFRAAKERGETQETIAARAGLRQNQISRLFAIDEYGPQTENFIKAIEGLGMTASEFFLQIERQTDSDLPARANVSTTARTPAENDTRGQDRPIPLDAAALLQAGNALVDAGGLFIAAAHGVEVKPRARARDSARRRPARERRRAGGNR